MQRKTRVENPEDWGISEAHVGCAPNSDRYDNQASAVSAVCRQAYRGPLLNRVMASDNFTSILPRLLLLRI